MFKRAGAPQRSPTHLFKLDSCTASKVDKSKKNQNQNKSGENARHSKATFRRANSIFSPIVQTVFKRLEKCELYSAFLCWRGMVRHMIHFDFQHNRLLKSIQKQKSVHRSDAKKSNRRDNAAGEIVLDRLQHFGSLSNVEMRRIIELPPITPNVEDQVVEKNIIKYFRRSKSIPWMNREAFVKMLNLLGIKNGEVIRAAFRAFDRHPLKGIPYRGAVDGLCVLMRLTSAQSLKFFFGALENPRVQKEKFREVLQMYAPALFSTVECTDVIDCLLYDLDTCGFGISPRRFFQQVSSVTVLHDVLFDPPQLILKIE